jgi:hypothetical protein
MPGISYASTRLLTASIATQGSSGHSGQPDLRNLCHLYRRSSQQVLAVYSEGANHFDKENAIGGSPLYSDSANQGRDGWLEKNQGPA